jgi:hypothetical protein
MDLMRSIKLAAAGSKTSLVNFAKSLAKLGIVGGIIGYVLWPETACLTSMIGLDAVSLLTVTQTLSAKGADRRSCRAHHSRCARLSVSACGVVEEAAYDAAGVEGRV